EFVIGVQLALAGTVGPGEVVVPGRLRYQACDDKMCFAPSNAAVEWTLDVVGADAAVTPQHADVLGAIPFGTGEAPDAAGGEASAPAAAPAEEGLEGGIARLDRFELMASTGGYLGTEDFLTFISNAEAGVQETGWFEG